jgi:hypothetical protein
MAYHLFMRKQMLLQKLRQLALVMMQGGLSETTRQCGNPGCACSRDPAQRHGPHLYLTYREQAKSRSLYVPAEHAAEARRAHAAWAEFWEVSCALAALNREQFRQHWEREKGNMQRRRPRA